MLELQQLIDVELIADRSRTLWRDATAWVTNGRVELFTKTSSRVRVARDLLGTGVTLDRAGESGLAVRVIQTGRDRAGFAACSGLGHDDVRWATETAAGYGEHTAAAQPRASATESERWDLDDEAPLPSEDTLESVLLNRTDLSWIEAGTTVEVIVGTAGWIAGRKRHRLWALAEGSGRHLFVQRGFTDWVAHLDADASGENGDGPSDTADGRSLILTPRAAAPVVAALVDTFHREGPAPPEKLGAGWELSDEPVRAEGLSGGSFDDAGFPTTRRVLAAEGLWVDALTAPGTYRRPSFRDPPAESSSNLVMAGGPIQAFPRTASAARRCRVIRSSPELWVLEFELSGTPGGGEGPNGWIKTSPGELIGCCRSQLGRARLTPDGPIVPFLEFDGLSGL